uniref:Uncharacterized protein n=1 Tax=Oryza glaberrima TaxID=4538 RepID=I1QH45_ORYGL
MAAETIGDPIGGSDTSGGWLELSGRSGFVGDEVRAAGTWLGVVVVLALAGFDAGRLLSTEAATARFMVAVDVCMHAADGSMGILCVGPRHRAEVASESVVDQVKFKMVDEVEHGLREVYDVTARNEFNFTWQDDCGDRREGRALLQVESRGRSYKDGGVSCYGKPGGRLSGQLGESGEKGTNLSLGTRRFEQVTNSGRRGIFAKVEFVRVCVEYVYVVGYSLGLGVVLGVGLEYESDSILGSLINRGACLL